MVEVRQRDNMLVGFDDNHLPLMISTFRGPLDLEAARWHDEVSSKAIAQSLADGRRVLHVVDARDVDVPSAQLRKFWAERISQSVSTIEAMLGVFVVIDKPILRGVLTAINWICNEARRVEYFPTLNDAVNLANVRFAAAGYPTISLNANGYDVPTEQAPRHSYQTTKLARITLTTRVARQSER
jgi:hypothetical protein